MKDSPVHNGCVAITLAQSLSELHDGVQLIRYSAICNCIDSSLSFNKYSFLSLVHERTHCWVLFKNNPFLFE